MESSVLIYQTKLKSLLAKFLAEQPPISVDEHLDKLIAHFRRHPEVESTRIALPLLTEWLKQAVVKWSTTRVHLRPNVAAFVLDLASVLAKTESTFCALNTNNFFIRLVNASKARCASQRNVRLAYVELLSSLLDHASGVEWMMACNFWEDVHRWCLTDGHEGVIVEGTTFVAKILAKTVEPDGSFWNGVVRKTMMPLGDNIYRAMKEADSMADVSEAVARRYLKPTLGLMGGVLERVLEGIYVGRDLRDVAQVLLRNLHLEERVSDLMMVAQAKCLAFDVGRIMFAMQFLELYVKVATDSIGVAGIEATVGRMKNNYMLNLSKGNFEAVVDFCSFGQLLWHLVEAKILRDKKRSFADELFIIFLIIPPYCLLLKYCWEKDRIEEMLSEEFRDRFIHKLFGMTSQDGVRACYHWRDHIVARSDIFGLCLLAIERIRQSIKYCSKDAAVLLAQTLIYFLGDLVDSVREFPRKLEPFLGELSYFSQVIDTLVVLLEEFHITWQDSLEATNVLTIAFDFLMINSWPKCIVVQVLRLIDVATAKNMAPSLALLLDSTTNSTIALLGPLLFAKLHDEDRDVKGAALGVARTVARMSSSILTVLDGDASAMNPKVAPLVSKTRLFLQKLHHGKYQTASTEFLTLLRQHEDTDVETAVILLPILSQWIKVSVVQWNTTGVRLQHHTAAFALNLAALLSRNESRFCDLNTDGFFAKLVSASTARLRDSNTAVKMAYVRLLAAILEHPSGVHWTTTRSFWEDALLLGDDVGDETRRFLCKLLERTVATHESFCDEVVKRILLPLGRSVYGCLEGGGTDAAAAQYLGPVLRLVGGILDHFLEALLTRGTDVQVVLLFFKHFRLEERITDFMVVSKAESIVFGFGKVVFAMQFVELFVKVCTDSLSASAVKTAVDKIRSNFVLSVSRGKFEDVLDFCNFAQLYWTLMDRKIPRVQDRSNSSRRVFPFGDQLIVLLLFPNNVLFVNHSLSRAQVKELVGEEFRDGFFYRMTRIVSPEVFRACYYWRESLLTSLRPSLYDLSGRGVRHVKNSRRFFSKDAAVTVVQSLIYSAKDFIHATKHSKLHGVDDLAYFTETLEVLALLIEEFDVTWKDSFEAVDVMVVAFEFLSLPGWSAEIAVRALRLIKVAVAKYLSPNMALLVDSPEDATVDLMGPLLYVKALDGDPKVKRAALEVMSTMAVMSTSRKFTKVVDDFTRVV